MTMPIKTFNDLVSQNKPEDISVQVAVGLDVNFAYLALHGLLGETYWLLCLERVSGKELWKANVWGSVWELTESGSYPVHQFVTILSKGDYVYVIGEANFCFYIEAFERKTGRPAFRFVNSYWREKH
jgi:hypothetical protein